VSVLQNTSLIIITNITSPKSNPTSAPTLYSRVTVAGYWSRSSFDWRVRGYWAVALARWALTVESLTISSSKNITEHLSSCIDMLFHFI
jgi:hypothetical protein